MNNNDKKNVFQKLYIKLFGQISYQEKINFARHLSVGIKSGMPILESLKLIAKQVTSKRFQEIITKVIQDVNEGQFFAQSLEHFGDTFGEFFVNMVRVGERSGTLSSALLYLSQELKKQREVSRRVKSAFIYPSIILVATLGITLFLTLFIFPKILPIFASLRVDLPFTTRFIIAFLKLLQHYGIYMAAGFVALIIGVRLLFFVEKIRFLAHRIVLHVPFISGFIVNVTMTNLTRSLNTLLKSGMTLIDALEIAKKTFGNLYYQRQIDFVIENVKRGESLAHYLETEPKLFPPMLTGMIQVGENTGNLEENLAYLAEYYESELDESVKNLTTVIEPVLLLVMGLVVGFVALSIITPIYSITQGLKTN